MEKTIDVCGKYEPLFNESGPRYTLLTGGRGSGKSFALSMALCCWMRAPGRKILFTRYTLTSAQDSIIPEFVEKLDMLQVSSEFDVSKSSIRHKMSGSEILFRGIKTSEGVQTAKLKSIQGVNAWVLDEAEELPDEETFDKIDLSVRDSRKPNRIILCLNPCHKSHWIHGRFVEPRPDTLRIHTDYRDNARNLPADYLARAEDCRQRNPRKYQNIWLGEWLDEVEGALWTYSMIQPNRLASDATPPMRRIVVAIDPAATSSESADETGIVAAGAGQDGRYYVLTDLTMRGSPMAWAGSAIGLYRRLQADRIVAETNNGGEMVEATLRAVDATVSYQSVTASRGKMIRAEPVAALYEKGLVSHCGTFKELEAELMTYTGAASQRSPNRMDALVWAISSLMGDPTRALDVF